MERKLFSWHPQGQLTEVSEASCHQGPYAHPSLVSPLQPPPPAPALGPLLGGPSPSVQLGHTFKEGYLLVFLLLVSRVSQREPLLSSAWQVGDLGPVLPERARVPVLQTWFEF